MKRLAPALLIVLLLLSVALHAQAPAVVVSSQAPAQEQTLFQAASLSALLAGNYDGWLPFADLKQRGDFGLGTFHALDGEMTQVDGIIYQIRSDGKVYPVSDTATTPFASTVFFRPTLARVLPEPLPDVAALEAMIDALRPVGLPCALRITGEFAYVKTRAVPAQTKPYPRLVEVAKTQPTFEFTDVTGVLVGFWLPKDFSGLNVPGYHVHFLTTDRRGGGHLLDVRSRRVTVELQPLRQFQLILPETLEQTGEGMDVERETAAVER